MPAIWKPHYNEIGQLLKDIGRDRSQIAIPQEVGSLARYLQTFAACWGASDDLAELLLFGCLHLSFHCPTVRRNQRSRHHHHHGLQRICLLPLTSTDPIRKQGYIHFKPNRTHSRLHAHRVAFGGEKKTMTSAARDWN